MSFTRMLLHACACALACSLLAGTAAAQIITTVAGGALPATPLPGVSASIAQPQAIAVDTTGNAYFSSGNAVFKLSASGTLTVVAGTAVGGYSGDTGPATSAQLNSPAGVAVDASGNLYIADAGNHRVRKVSAAGTITTVAGSGVCPNPTFGCYSGEGGLATSAQLDSPSGVAVDAGGNLYVADIYNSRVCKVSAAGIITTVAGSGRFSFTGDGGPATSAAFYLPQGVALDNQGNLYIADAGNRRIRKVSAGIVNTVAGGGSSFPGDNGPATSAFLDNPSGVAVDAGGNLYIADAYNNRVRKVSAGIITTLAGSTPLYTPGAYSGDGGPAASAQLYYPDGVAVDANSNVYIADTSNSRVRKVSGGIITTVAGGGSPGDNGLAVAAQLNSPGGVVVDSARDLYIADSGNSRIRKVSPAGVITTAAGNGFSGYSGDGATATSAQLNGPQSVAVDASGNLYIADSNNNRIRKVSAAGIISTVAGNGSPGYSGDNGLATTAQLDDPEGVAVDGIGNVYISDTGNSCIRKVSTAGIITTLAGDGSEGYSGDNGPAASAELDGPQGVAVDAGGNLYIADLYNDVIRKISAAGIITTVAGNGSPGYSGDSGPAISAALTDPTGVALDASGNLFIADYGNNRVRKVSAAGIINTVAGNGTGGYSGDGGPATSAQLNQPAGVWVDASGNLYVADSGNSRVRLVAAAQGAATYTVTTVPAGLAIVVDSAPLTAPQTFNWAAGSSHSISVTSPQGTGGTRYLFANWSDAGAQTHNVTAPTVTTTYTANFTTQYLLTTAVSPSAASSVAANPASPDGSGFYNSGTSVQLTATPVFAPMQFGNWSGDLTGAANPQSVTMSAARNVTANFTAPSGNPINNNAFFVNQLYLDLLGRPADSGGLSFWTGQLAAGAVSQSQLAYSFFTSPEFQSNGFFVISAYIAVLGRNPDYAGWLYWLGNLQAGLPQQQVINAFIQSTEFQTTYGTLNNTAFVTLVYQNVLGRAPDSGGLSYWVGLLNSGGATRAQCMYSFATSTEFQNQIQNQALATLLYMGFLRRSPDPSGVTYWTGQLNAGVTPAAVLSAFIASAEYLARF